MAIAFQSTNSLVPSWTAGISGYGNAPAANQASALGSVSTAPVAQSSAFSSLVSQLSTPTTQAALQAYKEDPRLTQMLADLMTRAQQSDAEISSQANGAYEAQRKVADQQIDRQQTRSLAANGVLPTGGLAAQYRTELANPIYDRLNAQRAQTELDLRNQRDGVKQNVTGTLAGLDNNRNQFTLSQLNSQQQAEYQRQQLLAQTQYQQASLSQQAQLASQQLAAEQARAQQSASLAQQQLDYNRQRDAQSLAFQREQAQLQNQRYYSNQGNGSLGNGSTISTLGSGSVFGEDDDRAMRNNYQNMVSAENLRSGRNADGSYRPPSTSQSQTRLPTTSQSSQSTITSPASNRDAFGMQSQSFYNPPSTRDAFQMPTLGFNY